jgi:hypothetical protein
MPTTSIITPSAESKVCTACPSTKNQEVEISRRTKFYSRVTLRKIEEILLSQISIPGMGLGGSKGLYGMHRGYTDKGWRGRISALCGAFVCQLSPPSNLDLYLNLPGTSICIFFSGTCHFSASQFIMSRGGEEALQSLSLEFRKPLKRKSV